MREVEPPEPGVGQERGVDLALLQLPQARLDVAPEVDHLERGVLGQELRLPAQGGAPDDGPLGELLEGAVLGRDERVPHVLAREVAGEHRAGGQVGGHILHRVHRNVDAAVQEGVVLRLRDVPNHLACEGRISG